MNVDVIHPHLLGVVKPLGPREQTPVEPFGTLSISPKLLQRSIHKKRSKELTLVRLPPDRDLESMLVELG